MKKKFWALLITIAMVLCLSACMKEEKGIVLTPTGSVKLFSKVSMNEQVINSTYGSVDAFYEASTPDLENNGYTVQQFSETDDSGAVWYGYSATSKAYPKSDAEAALSQLMGEEYIVTLKQTGFFVKTVEVHLEYVGASQEEYASYGFESYFSITAPAAISETNGAVEPDDNKVAKWDLASIQTTGAGTIDMTVTYFNIAALLIIIGIVVVIAAAVVTALVILNKKKKADESEFGAFGEAPAGFSNFDDGMQNDFEEAKADIEAAQEEIGEAQEEVQADFAEAQAELEEAAVEVTEEV